MAAAAKAGAAKVHGIVAAPSKQVANPWGALHGDDGTSSGDDSDGSDYLD